MITSTSDVNFTLSSPTCRGNTSLFPALIQLVCFLNVFCLIVLQDFAVKILLFQCMSSYLLPRLAWSNCIHIVSSVMCILPWCSSALPFACLSNPASINKPMPLKLNVSFPSFQDLKWSISRLYYLFNIQLERNIGV